MNPVKGFFVLLWIIAGEPFRKRDPFERRKREPGEHTIIYHWIEIAMSVVIGTAVAVAAHPKTIGQFLVYALCFVQSVYILEIFLYASMKRMRDELQRRRSKGVT